MVVTSLTLLVLSHGAYPLAYQLLEKPQTPQSLVAGTTFGVLLSTDDGVALVVRADAALGLAKGSGRDTVVTAARH